MTENTDTASVSGSSTSAHDSAPLVFCPIPSRRGSAWVAKCGIEDPTPGLFDHSPHLGPITVENAPSMVNPLDDSGKPLIAEDWLNIKLPLAGLVAVVGTAGTGKSTMVKALAAHLQERRSHVYPITYMEPDTAASNVVTSDSEFAKILAGTMARASSHAGSVVVIDSLRAWVTLGTGYPDRLGTGGWDLTMFPALTQLDIAAKQLGVLVVAAVYVEAMQLGAADPGNNARTAELLTLLLRSLDGSATTSVLMGPSPSQRGHFLTLTRLARSESPTAGFLDLQGSEPKPLGPTDFITPTNATDCLELKGHGPAWATELIKHSDDAVEPFQDPTRFYTEEDFTGEGRARRLLNIMNSH